MLWQDYAVTIIVYMFVLVTIPQLKDVIKGKTSLNLITAGATTIGNYCLGFVFFTLNLWLSVTSAFFIASLWFLIFIFSIKNIKNRENNM
jgi:small-conductance mechanosensitive channel